MEKKERSLAEKILISRITKSQSPLPYVLKKVEIGDYMEEKVYIIPEDKKEEMIKKCWLFVSDANMEDEYLDIHEGRRFILKDAQIIRWHRRNIIVSPYYFISGGTLIDFVIQDSMIDVKEIINKEK